MRHLLGVLLAVAVSAALVFGGGWGLAHLSVLGAHGAVLASVPGALALAAVLATGMFLGVLMAAPAVSPLATGLPGVSLLAWTALVAVNAHLATAWMPMPDLTAVAGFRSVLGSGTLALVGTAMAVPLFMPSRWHRSHGDEDEEETLPAPTGLLA